MRLLLVWSADPAGGYGWMPPARPGDIVVSFDLLAAEELASRQPLRFDDLLSWEDRSAAEHQVSRILAAVHASPALASQKLEGHKLADFADYRLRAEFASVLRGWAAGRAAQGCTEMISDPGTPAALVIGARAALGLDVEATPYTVAAPPVVPSGPRRAVARAQMRTLAAASRSDKVRVVAVMAAKVVPALSALTRDELRAAGIGTAPFPGLDYGNSARLAVRLRVPMLLTLDPARPRAVPRPQTDGRLRLDDDPALDRALCRVTTGLIEQAWPQFVAAVAATRGLERARNLRALLLPTSAVGASQVLMGWARRHGVAVAVVQHGVYGFREFDGGDRRADVLFAWSPAVERQGSAWVKPRPRIVPVGVPGMPHARARAAPAAVHHVLVATTGRPLESALSQAAFHQWFIEAVTPGLRRLVEEGVVVELRLHPAEEAGPYRRSLAAAGLGVPIASPIPLDQAVAQTDVLVCAPSSVAFEAAALGAPVLLWNSAMPAEIRREHLVPPWGEDLPGTFDDAPGFSTLVEGLLAAGTPAMRTGADLARRLAMYAEPFDAARFSAGLLELAR